MSTLMRDSVAGHAVRLLTKGRFFKYAEERDPSLWQRYTNTEKSARMASTGRTDGDNVPDEDVFANTASVPAIPASAWEHHGHRFQGLTGVRINPEHGKDVNVIDWHEDDSENPQNWPLAKKVFVTFEVCLLTFSVYIGSAIYTPGIPAVMTDFHVSHVTATLGLTFEVPYIGRNPVYIFTLAVFVALQVPTALAGNLGTLLALRFLAGFIGSPPLATGGATIADMFRPAKRAYAIGIWGISAVCGPVMGPLVGGFAAQAKGWRWTIWELMWLSGFSLLMLLFFLPETSSANILYRRARRLRRLTGRENLKCEPEIESEGLTGREMLMIVLVRPFTLNFTEPMVFLLNLYIALIYGLLYVWFESFPIVFTGIYHFNLGQLGLAFLGTSSLNSTKTEISHLKLDLDLPSLALVLSQSVCSGFGWSARPEIHWIMPIIGSGFFAVGAFLLFNAILNYLPDAYPAYAVSVLAGNDLFRSGFGAGFPLFATAMYENLGVGWASSTLAFLSIAFIPIPFVLMKSGATLRKKYMGLSRLLELAPKTLETTETTVIRLATFADLELTRLDLLKPFDRHEAERICDEEAEIIEAYNRIVTGFRKQYQSLGISLMQFMQDYWCPQMQEYLCGGVNLDEACSTQSNDLGITLTPSTRLHSNAVCVHLHPKVTEGNEASPWTLLS
ncbi:hypothetical protein CNMCM7691_001385 [Aspergillus felis]|uniref:Major facilitator superfamily (MFS) profile domain-containing protein n=1 Tax=Aspergillus felis TaxID=1287682 RepID=A0A8H6R182_9EURO|nr:hypothetical protein CNMCM7691_001385 [Aspergillus felis]